MSTNIQIKLYKLLSDRSFYSLRLDYVAEQLNIPDRYLRLMNHKNRNISTISFRERFNDMINIFKYRNIEYIGLDYEDDKEKGINWVEDAIKRGIYN